MAQHQMTNGLAIYLHPKGGKAGEVAEFYKQAFDAQEMSRMPAEDGKRIMHVHLTVNGGNIMMSDEFPEYAQSQVREMGGFDIHLQVDDADLWFNRAVAAGCTAKMPLEDQFWGDRYGSLRDPYGVDWSIGGPIKG